MTIEPTYAECLGCGWHKECYPIKEADGTTLMFCPLCVTPPDDAVGFDDEEE